MRGAETRHEPGVFAAVEDALHQFFHDGEVGASVVEDGVRRRPGLRVDDEQRDRDFGVEGAGVLARVEHDGGGDGEGFGGGAGEGLESQSGAVGVAGHGQAVEVERAGEGGEADAFVAAIQFVDLGPEAVVDAAQDLDGFGDFGLSERELDGL